MKFKTNERGFVMAEFAIALPLLIILLYSLGLVTLSGLKIAREQVANYVLETEAQYVIERITTDARAAQFVKVVEKPIEDDDLGEIKLGKIIFVFHANRKVGNLINFYDIYTQRIYLAHRTEDKQKIHVYAKRTDDNNVTTPITGDNIYGDTRVTKFEVDRDKLKEKIFHFTIAMQSKVTNQVVEFNTAVYMPACKKIIYN